MQTVRYAIVGFGNVGAALARHAGERRASVAERYRLDFRLVAALDSRGAVVDAYGLDALALADWKDAGKSLGDWPGSEKAPTPERFFDAAVDCLVECLPTNLATGEPGIDWVRAALERGADVVLADKGPLVASLPDLEALAAERGRGLGTSGTTGGALPTLTVARRELAGATLREVSGVLNGTSNLILTRMRASGASFEEALAEAQREGIAEPDPSYDVDGWDTAVKLVIIARGVLDPSLTLDQVARTGVREMDPDMAARARASGGRLRLVGRARLVDGRAVASVAPEIVAPDDPFFGVEGSKKGVRFASDEFADLVVLGGASGRRDVAAAMLKDMILLAGDRPR